jgi:hypothetical protein
MIKNRLLDYLLQGDAGAPVVANANNGTLRSLIAVTSSLLDCTSDRGALATKITVALRTWISSKIST